MKIATWNVNSLKVRLPQVLAWLGENSGIDALCVQETKLRNEVFPAEDIRAAGLHCAFNGQKTYNGVAILARRPLADVVCDIPGFADEQKRVIAATMDGVRLVNVYVVNGQEVGADKYAYKLRWLAALRAYLDNALAQHPALAVLGDFNIAPDDRDVHDPAAWAGKILCSDAERDAFRALLALGLEDTFRRFEQPEATFSWWDYRQAGFRRNLGLRIDHILVSAPLAVRCAACAVDKTPRGWERPSDHAPVVATFDAAPV
ncbi:MAG: exodeoxyribonuclease III [Nevskiaceae bacterium]|nr:MAG: exodeoxyribonuclease III [Nevskiaceae bacterium]TBR73736.1 MAG: exodeoxyribonuclease III [Nevskiaceae bacterium]